MERVLKPYSDYKGSGIPWLGMIPSHWETRRAKWLFAKMERPVRPEDETITCFRDGVVTLRKNRRTTGFTESLQEIGYQGIRKGDLVIHAMDAFAGAVGVSDSDGKGTPVYVVCKPNPGVDAEYYARVVREMARSQYIAALAKGIRQRSTDFRYATFAGEELPTPPPEEQYAIARFLGEMERRVNRLIRAKQRLIELLNEQKQAIIQRAVTRGLDPDVRLKPSGVEWLGEVPEHWEVAPLKIFADIRISGVDKHSVPGEIEIRLCNYTDVYHQDFIDSSHEFMWATATPKEIEAFELRRGDVIITKDSETWDDIAVPAVVTEDLHGVVCGYHLALIRPSKQVEGEFLLRALQAPIIASQFHVAATGVTRYGLSKHSIKSAVIPLPPLSEQQAIIESVRQQVFVSDETADRARREIKFLREYRTRLIADVVTGKLDVRGVDVPDAGDQEELFEAEIPGEEEHLSMQEAM